MSFQEAVKTCLSRYVTFSGRASRSEYWWFALFVVLGSVVVSLIDAAVFGVPDPSATNQNGPLASLFSLAMLLPVLAAGWRRLHDTGRPGWYLLLPMAVSLVTFVSLMFGVLSFSALEATGADQDALRGGATLLGMSGLIVMGILQIILGLLMLWWLTRPSQQGSNDYGPSPQ